METLYALFIFPLITSLINSFIHVFCEWVIRNTLYMVEFKSDSMIRNLDEYLMKHNSDIDISHGSTKTPMNTWHFRYVDGYQFVVLIRKSNYNYNSGSENALYLLYGLSEAFSKIKQIAIKKSNDSKYTDNKVTKESTSKTVETCWFESSSYYKTSFTQNDSLLPSDTPYTGQLSVLDLIIANYNESLSTNKKKCSALLFGNPGVGKSNVGMYLASKLNARVVYGYRLTVAGICLDELWRLNPTEKSPVILVLDEIDCAFKKAQKAEEPRQLACLAQDKTALNSLFDRFERTNYLIVLGTSNDSFEKLIEDGYSSYMRKGRFDHCLTLSQESCIVNVNSFN